MPNEPEREIEKTLRVCAKERGDAADTVLHPATRRLLLDEAAEAYPAAQIKPPRRWRWYFSWPQLAPALGIFVLLAMASFFMWPAPPGEMRLASNREVFKNAPDSGVKSKALAALNRSRNYEAVDALEVTEATKRPMNSAGAVAKDDGAPATLNDGAPLTAAAQPQPEPVAPPEISVTNSLSYASAPRGTTGLSAVGGGTSLQLSDLTFDLAAATQARDFVSLKSTPAKPVNSLRVLKKFRVEQSGNVLRIIDGDGSVYLGNWVPTINGHEKQSEALTPGKNVEGAIAPGGNYNLSLAGTLRSFGEEPIRLFRVIGTNLSLNGKVIFNGRFDPNTFNLGIAQAEKPASKKADKADNSKWLSGEISGSASVGSNVFKILAKPAGGK